MVKHIILPQQQRLWYRWCLASAIHVWLSCSADKDFDSKISTNVLVSSDGTCFWSPPGLFQSSCSMDILWFPFDDQICRMKFGSWTYNGFQLNLRLQGDNIDLSNYFHHNEWLLIGRSVQYLHFIMKLLEVISWNASFALDRQELSYF